MDLEDLIRLGGKTVHKSPQGYQFFRVKNETVLLHRFVMGCVPGDGKVVDHINGVKMDNRKCNLRVVSQSRNIQKGKRRRPSQTGFRGVQKQGVRFRAYATLDRKLRHLGTFDTAEEAARAYDEFAKANFGEHAFLNFE
jgi:hypothetical protein